MLASQSQPSASNNRPSSPLEMVTPSQAKALKKEGYRLIGTHSAVKLCRWTKHQLRGRGGCYKHTFYGITSYQCMEATPSLACANKCVFCWRHHKNPVGKEWRWKTDDPHYIVDQAVQTHVQMIKETKGIPGVQMDRWKEAHTVRHCALSLVGEPIMYPRIDELLADLHSRNISTFLVTNGQHPSAIASLRPITQLYVSVDAPSRESLIAIDRPLFSDAWERLRESLSSLRDKGQRTVARLTVVKGWNSDELEGYAQLIALGHVSLVEVKGKDYKCLLATCMLCFHECTLLTS
jgi:tRNA wybutosine-synthesizing protein 1